MKKKFKKKTKKKRKFKRKIRKLKKRINVRKKRKKLRKIKKRKKARKSRIKNKLALPSIPVKKIKIPQFIAQRKKLKKLTFQKVLNFLLDPVFRAYEDFRERRKIEKLRIIALEKKKRKDKSKKKDV